MSATEALEAALVIIALIPKSYSSALLGTLIAAGGAVVLLTIALKDQIARIRLPHLKFVLSSLLFSLGTMWGGWRYSRTSTSCSCLLSSRRGLA